MVIKMAVQRDPSIVYNVVDTLVKFDIPPEYQRLFFTLKQQGEAGYREYDAKVKDLMSKGWVQITPIGSAEELLHLTHEHHYKNSVYSASSEERLRMIFQILGWNELIDSMYGTLGRPEIFDKERPASYENLKRIMHGEGLDPKFYVTTKPAEAEAARHTLEVVLIQGIRKIPSLGEMVQFLQNEIAT